MKKLLTILLALAMILSLATAAFASGEASKSDDDLIALQNTADGSALPPIVETSFTGTRLAYPRYAYFVNQNASGEISDNVSWHNGAIYSEPGTHTVNGASFEMNTAADGSDTNDFSGLGAAVLVTGSGVVLEVNNSKLETTGVAKLALFTDAGAASIVRNSTLTSNSGTIYNGYMSTADQTMMVAPPWVLGLGGPLCNARTTNIMGNYSAAAYIDSTFNAAGWGALSTDSGTNMHMLVINSTVNVDDSGYGAYTIGESTEDYYGVKENVSTYANIMTGGVATYQSYIGGTDIDFVQFAGETDEYGFGTGGNVVAKVSSGALAPGQVVNSVINSDNFGFMCHANGPSGWNVVNLCEGTEVNTGDAIFLVKKVNSIFNVDKAVLNSASGVLLQLIDNDDDYVGLDFSASWGIENGYGHSVGGHIPTFNSTFHEEPGYSNSFAVNTTGVENNWTSELNLSFTTVDGDVWNSTGYVGSNPATTLTVNLGEGAELNGIISAGAFSHTTKDAQVGNGDWSQAAALGHVENIVNSNGKNLVNVNLSGDAVWTVESDSYIDSLNVADSAKVVVPAGVTLTVGSETYTGTTISAQGASGEPAAAPSGEPAAAPSGEPAAAPSGEPAAAPSGEPAAAGDTSQAAFIEYIHQWLLDELAVNSNMTIEQVEDEFMPLVEQMNFTDFPAEMIYSGMLEQGVPMTYDEFVAAGGK